MPVSATVPTAETVLGDLAVELDGVEGVVDRVSIIRATDREYMCRVWLVGQEDFDGYQIYYTTE